MTVRIATAADRAAWRAIWNSTAASIDREGMRTPALTLRQAQEMIENPLTTPRVWEDATATVDGIMLTLEPQTMELSVVGLVRAQECRVLFPRPSVSRALFRQVMRELLQAWYDAMEVDGTEYGFGRIPRPASPLIEEFFTEMRTRVGTIRFEDSESGFRRLISTPRQGRDGVREIV